MSAEIIRSLLATGPIHEGGNAPIGLEAIDTALANFLSHTGSETDPLIQLLAAITSQQLRAGHICLVLDDFLAQPDAYMPPPAIGSESESTLSDALSGLDVTDMRQRLAHSPVVDTGVGNAPLVFDGERLYLRRYWEYETFVAENLRQRAKAPNPLTKSLGDTLDQLFPRRGADTIDWPRVAAAQAARHSLSIITGGPGTGKTTTVVRLLGLLQTHRASGQRALRIRLAAPTGKAAARLTESISERISELPVSPSERENIPAEVTTLHRLLGRRPGSRQFRHNRQYPVHADVVVVDEASMIDLEMMASLLDALSSHTRLILIGDKDQLASVEAGAVMGDLCAGAAKGAYDADTISWIAEEAGTDVSAYAGDGSFVAQQTAMLRSNYRFGETSGIGALATAINAGNGSRALELITSSNKTDVICEHLAAKDETRIEAIACDGLEHYLHGLRDASSAQDPEITADQALAAFGAFQLLAIQRSGPAGVEALNSRIARALQARGLIGHSDGWYAGRPVMMTRNDYKLGLMNGDVGITLAVPASENQKKTCLRVAFRLPNGRIRLVLPSRLGDVDTVYAMTVHKAQGSEFRHTALAIPHQDHALLTRELLYTAVTRASEKFTLLASQPELIASAVQRPTRRASGLAERLTV